MSGCSQILVWTWGDGGASISVFPATHSYCAGGTYTITATVEQPNGQTASATATVRVTGSNSACSSAVFLSTPSVAGMKVTVGGDVASCPSTLTTASISWTWGDGSTSSSPFPASHVYSNPGDYTVVAKATESDGSVAEASTRFSVGATATGADWSQVGPTLSTGATLQSGQGGTPPGTTPCPAGVAGAGKLTGFAYDPTNTSILYVSSGLGQSLSGPYGEGGVFKSVDGGKSWIAIDDGLTDPMVEALWVDPSSPNVVLAGTAFAGIFRSTDGGAHWAAVSSPATQGSAYVTGFATQGGTVLAGTSVGLLESSDGGRTWQFDEQTSSGVVALSASGGYVYMGLADGDIVLQSSPTSGWNTVFQDAGWIVYSIAVNPSDPTNAYIVEFHNYQSPGVYSTTDAGATWSQVHAFDNAFGPQAVAFDSSNPSTLYVGTDGNFYASTDGGATFVAYPLQVDVRSIHAGWDGAGTVMVTSDQGIFSSTSGGAAWSGLNANLANNLLYDAAVSADGSKVFAAVQDYSPIQSLDGGRQWQVLSTAAGEDGEAVINPLDPSYVYLYTNAGLYYSADGGNYFWFAQGLGSQGSIWTFQGTNNQLAFDLGTPGSMYIGTSTGVYHSSDWGVTWSLEGWPFTTTSLVAVDPTDGSTIAVGTAAGLYVSRDGGSTWTKSSLSQTAGVPDSLAIDPLDGSVWLLGTSNPPQYGGGVFRSTDAGGSFVQVDTGLPRAPDLLGLGQQFAWRLAFEPGNDTVALASTAGIFASGNLGASWVDISGNVIPKFITSVSWVGSELYASTYGEGVVKLAFTSSLLQGSTTTTTSSSSTSTSTSTTTSTSSTSSTSTSVSTSTTSTSSSTSTSSTSTSSHTSSTSSSGSTSSSSSTTRSTSSSPTRASTSSSESSSSAPVPEFPGAAALLVPLVSAVLAASALALAKRKARPPVSAEG
jgi:photosystem II stability/assembly factor-like uncharacterized protein